MTDPRANLHGLAPEQRRIVEWSGGTIRVLAGPGTGKTEALARRFVHLIQTGRAAPEEIVLLTFSRRAAADVRGRIERRLGSSHGALRVTTFHGFCHALLRENASLASLPCGFSVLTPFKGWLVLRLAAERASLPSSFARLRRSPRLLEEAHALIRILKQSGVSPGALQEAVRGECGSAELRALASIYASSDSLLEPLATLDLDDLVGRAAALLESAETESIRLASIRHVMVDEYQDTSPMEARLLAALARRVARGPDGRPNLMVIGDPDQSVYRFRGTTLHNLLRFPERFPLSAGGDVRLAACFRAVPEVFEIAAALNRLHRREPLVDAVATRQKAGSEAVQAIREESAASEAFFIARRILELLAGDSADARCRPSDIAILCRSVERIGRTIEMALRSHGIPHRIAGATTFHRHPLVRLAVCAIRFLAGVDPDDSLARVLSAKPLGLDQTSLRRCQRRAREAGLPSPLGYHRFQDAFETPREREVLTTFLIEAEALRDRAAGMHLTDVVYEVLRLTHVFEHLAPADEEARAAARNVARFHEMAREYEDVARLRGVGPSRALLVRFAEDLDEAARRFADEREPSSDEEGGDAVQILTVHQAKGLEFRAVFVAGLADGLFPLPATEAPALFGPELVPLLRRLTQAPLPWPETREEHLSEERRLAYVAVTRARDRLFLTRAARYAREAPESPFFAAARLHLPPAAYLENPVGRGPASLEREAPLLTRLEIELSLRRALSDLPDRAALLERLTAWNAALPEAIRLDLEFVSGGTRYERDDARAVSLPQALTLRATSLRDFLQCPRKFYYRHVLDLDAEDTFHKTLGSFLHEVLETFHRRHPRLDPGRQADYEAEFAGIVDERFSAARERFSSEIEAQTALSIARDLGSEYVEEECRAAAGRETVLVEERAAFELAGHVIEAKIDRVDAGPEGLEIVDYKTSRETPMEVALKRQFLPERDKPPVNFQLPLYWLGLERTRGMAAYALTVYHLRRRSRDDRGLRRARLCIAAEPSAKSVSVADLRRVEAAIGETIERMREGDFRPAPREPARCGECDFRGVCYLQS